MASRKEILELLANGKITADEAADMLTAPAEAPAATPEVETLKVKTAVSPTPTDGEMTPRWFRVRVRNLESGKNKVSVNIPVGMLKFGMKIGKRFAPEIETLDWNELDGMVNTMQTGMLVEVQDDESNEHVQVFLE